MAQAAAEPFDDPIEGRRSLQYGTTTGDLRLRARLVEFLEKSDGRAQAAPTTTPFREPIVTTGSAQLIYLVCEALLDPGDIVLVESPTYFVFLGPIETSAGTGDPNSDRRRRAPARSTRGDSCRTREPGRPRTCQVDLYHPRTRQPDRDQPGRRAGAGRSWIWPGDGQKTTAFLCWRTPPTAACGLEPAEPPSLWSLDAEGDTVILARTFSKTLSPGLKTGYGILPRGLVEPILTLKGNHDFGSANLNQQLVERILADGSYERHVAQVDGICIVEKCRCFWRLSTTTWDRSIRTCSWTRPQGGLFVWMTVPEGLDTSFDGPLFSQCVREGVLYVPGDHALCSGARGGAQKPPPAHFWRSERARVDRWSSPAGARHSAPVLHAVA